MNLTELTSFSNFEILTESHTRTLAEILKCSFDEWNRIKKF